MHLLILMKAVNPVKTMVGLVGNGGLSRRDCSSGNLIAIYDTRPLMILLYV